MSDDQAKDFLHAKYLFDVVLDTREGLDVVVLENCLNWQSKICMSFPNFNLVNMLK